MGASINVDVDLNRIEPKINSATQVVQMALSQQVLKDSNFYIPKQTGNLERTGITASNLQKGELIWDAAYSKRVYDAVGITIHKKVNPNASPKWFGKAKSVHMASWLKYTSNEYGKQLKG